MPCCRFITATVVLLLAYPECNAQGTAAPVLERIRIAADGRHLVRERSGQPFTVWGVNYDRDRDGRLIEDYWQEEWATVASDFQEIQALGANTVRVHLQLGRFMVEADRPHQQNLARLADLVQLAERTGVYLQITGLGCYHKGDVPPWYDKLPEAERWQVQQRFWEAIAKICGRSPATFSYDLMNEPILPGEKPETEWLAGDYAGKHFVQRIALDLAGRSREEVARAWVEQLTSSIRRLDNRTLLTIGVIPWAHVFPKARPIFYSSAVAGPLDLVSVHFYPKRGEVEKALAALRVYEIGKPLLVSEIFPLHCTIEEAGQFIDATRPTTAGYISFYWGETVDELRRHDDLQSAVTAKWLEYFTAQAE